MKGNCLVIQLALETTAVAALVSHGKLKTGSIWQQRVMKKAGQTEEVVEELMVVQHFSFAKEV